jgi:hypothetical protein
MTIEITLAACFRFVGRMAAACVLGWAAHAAAQPAAETAGEKTSTAGRTPLTHIRAMITGWEDTH